MRALQSGQTKLISGGRSDNVWLVHNILPAPADLCELVGKGLQIDDMEEIETTRWRTMRLELVGLLLFALVLLIFDACERTFVVVAMVM